MVSKQNLTKTHQKSSTRLESIAHFLLQEASIRSICICVYSLWRSKDDLGCQGLSLEPKAWQFSYAGWPVRPGILLSASQCWDDKCLPPLLAFYAPCWRLNSRPSAHTAGVLLMEPLTQHSRKYILLVIQLTVHRRRKILLLFCFALGNRDPTQDFTSVRRVLKSKAEVSAPCPRFRVDSFSSRWPLMSLCLLFCSKICKCLSSFYV